MTQETNRMATNVTNEELSAEFRRLIETAQKITADVGAEADRILREGFASPLDAGQAERLLTRVIEVLRAGAESRGDTANAQALDVHELLRMANAVRERVRQAGSEHAPARMAKEKTVHLIEDHNGIKAGEVVPIPVFHEKAIPMVGGYIKTQDINLWGSNERLEIHVGQFRAKNGRAPSPEELFHIMTGKMPLEGVGEGEDEFKIAELAKSIAANGVRQPPIIDVDGTLLDGNRRVSACMAILANTSGLFSAEEKKRAEHIYVWQLTAHALNEDRRRVIVSLNFEDDYKVKWPKYIKARKVAEEWEALLALQPRAPGPVQQKEMKRALARKYALDVEDVTKFIKMVSWVRDFEDHLVNLRKQDEFKVKHASSRYFEYFDELSKGEKPGGVAWTLAQDDKFKEIVFDLLYSGKFDSFAQIRQLKTIATIPEARDHIAKAHAEPDVPSAQEHVDDAVTIAKTKDAASRYLGANSRIETFSKWLEEVPPRAFRDDVYPENLRRLINAMDITIPVVRKALEERESPGAS
jgi:hypothetical protein